MLFNNQSTVNVFCNSEHLEQIHTVSYTMTIGSNGGKSTTDQIGYLRGYGWVWFDPNGIANIISTSQAESKDFTVTYQKPSFFVKHTRTRVNPVSLRAYG